jgi:hypothetical protein
MLVPSSEINGNNLYGLLSSSDSDRGAICPSEPAHGIRYLPSHFCEALAPVYPSASYEFSPTRRQPQVQQMEARKTNKNGKANGERDMTFYSCTVVVEPVSYDLFSL